MTLLALALAAALSAAPSPASTPSSPHAELVRDIERIFGSRELAAKTLGDVRWIDGGRAYTKLEPAAGADPRGAAGPRDVVEYDTATGKRTVLVPAAKLAAPGASAPISITDYQWSEGRSKLLVFTNAKKVWRQNTRGDYWVYEVASGSLKKVGGDAPESSLLFARFSPDGTRVAWVRANDLWVQDLASGAITRLTSTGSETTINGTSDWVTEEELRLREAYRWSPDGRSIAYWSFDTSGVGVYTLIDDTGSLYPEVKRYPYPKVGTKNSAVRIGVVPAAGGETKWIALPGDPRESYVARMEWVKDGSGSLVLERTNRLQNVVELYATNPTTGEARSIYRDESKTWVEVTPVLQFVGGGRGILMESERDGWRHVWRVPRDGGAPVLVTRFEGDVLGVEGVDEKNGWLYFLASPERATERHLYRCRLESGGKSKDGIERVGPPRPGSETWDVAPDRRWAFHGTSRFDDPPVYELVRLPDYAVERPLLDNAELRKAVAGEVASPVEFFRLPIGDGVALDGWMLKPPGFDASKKYPVIVFVYGEPGGATVVDRWAAQNGLFHRALAREGYVVVSFDNRGTPAPRGEAWRHVVYGAIGELGAKDQAAAVRALAAARPYVDASRVGIWGWSGGGSSTLNAMFRFPDVYKVGVSVAPVPDQLLYDTIYQERYMGLPETNADGYRRGSPISFAEGLKGKLLVVHGSGDDNVHYQGTEKLANKLIELGKPFDLMVYPGRTHAISEGKGTSAHIHALIARYFLENL